LAGAGDAAEVAAGPPWFEGATLPVAFVAPGEVAAMLAVGGPPDFEPHPQLPSAIRERVRPTRIRLSIIVGASLLGIVVVVP
jgi:hypothetical protein